MHTWKKVVELLHTRMCPLYELTLHRPKFSKISTLSIFNSKTTSIHPSGIRSINGCNEYMMDIISGCNFRWMNSITFNTNLKIWKTTWIVLTVFLHLRSRNMYVTSKIRILPAFVHNNCMSTKRMFIADGHRTLKSYGHQDIHIVKKGIMASCHT